MVNYREILRLHSLGQSQRTIRSSAHCSDNTVRTVLEVASQKGIQWPLDDDITNADLRFTNWWTFRAGIGYETSPVDDPSYRTAIIPDADRWWFALGSSFQATKNMQVDVSAAWLHGTGERDLYTEEGGNVKAGRFENLDAYLFGVQLVYKF